MVAMVVQHSTQEALGLVHVLATPDSASPDLGISPPRFHEVSVEEELAEVELGGGAATGAMVADELARWGGEGRDENKNS